MLKIETVPTGGYAIIGDIHGQTDLLKQVSELIDPYTVRFVVQDQLDKGPAVRETMLFSKEIGAIALADNHSWITGNALLFDEIKDYIWLRGWYNHLEDNTLESFGLVKTGNPARDATALKHTLAEDDLLPYVLETAPYLEPEEDDFIAVHAGLTPVTWEIQKQELDECTPIAKRPEAAPQQVFDDDHFSHSSSEIVYPGVTNKVVVTGHSHLTLPRSDRITDGGKRVRIASNLLLGEPLFVYLTQTGEILEVPQRTP